MGRRLNPSGGSTILERATRVRGENVGGERYQSLELRLAEAGTDLRAAIEAAQFARLIHHEPPSSVSEEKAIARFVGTFSAGAESWEGLDVAERAALLARLGDDLEALENCALFVHWGMSGQDVVGAGRRAVRLPLAVLTIGRSRLPTTRTLIPARMVVDRGTTSLH
jgi:hypothetical protein